MTNSIATLQELKFQLNIEQDFTEEDTYLVTLLNAAYVGVCNYLNVDDIEVTAETEMRVKPLKIAVLILAANLYDNRTPVSFAQSYEIPNHFKFLLTPYKNFSIA